MDDVPARLEKWSRNAADTCDEAAQLPELDSLLPASLNLPFTWSLRKTTAAITARAMRATRRMYSTIEAPFSSLANFASSHVRNTNRFMEVLSFGAPPTRGSGRVVRGNTFGTLCEGLEHG